MVGIVLISHGNMADGMVDSAKMLFGETGMTQVCTVSLFPEEGPEGFDVKLTDAINSVNEGEGVIILADLLGGTPCNRAAYKCLEGFQVITGMNLPLFVELLGMRMGGNIDINSLISTAANGIVNLNSLLEGKGNL